MCFQKKIVSVVLAIIAHLLFPRCFAQEQNALPKGPFEIGYRVLPLPFVETSKSDTIQLILNLWYPTRSASGHKMRLSDYISWHKSLQPSDEYRAFTQEATQKLKTFVERSFGSFSNEAWSSFLDQKTNAFLNVPYHDQAFPLVIGRLRAFSTTFTNEFLASNGYVVCMINSVEDHPPDNRAMYYRQVMNEIGYFLYVKNHLAKILKLASGKSGLMGFSGGGFSQFLAPMQVDEFSGVALLESGIFLDGDLFDIVSHYPKYNPSRYETPLLYLYNKKRYESNAAAKNFFTLKTNHKFAVLFNDSSQHHWDFATEGIASSLYLNNRTSPIRENQLSNFRKMNELILRFFDCYLKDGDAMNLVKSQVTIIDPGGL
jgi:hypothetical protein